MNMERLSNKSPCKDCDKDKQIGNPYVWQTPCHDCEKKRQWVLERLARLDKIENILGDTYDLDRLRELVEADKDGRIKIIPGYIDKACGTCAHFLRIEGTCRGKCAVKPLACSRYTTWNSPFEPSQSRKACKQYIAAESAFSKEAYHE